MARIAYILFFTFVMLLSCDSRPGGVPSRGKMEKLLYDYHKAQAAIDVSSTDNSVDNEKYMLGVLAKYGLDSEMFDSAMVWYSSHPDELRIIYKNLEERLKAEDDEMQAHVGTSEMTAIYSEGGDTTNIWSGASLIALRPDRLHNLERFTFKADTSYHKTDMFTLHADVKLIKEDQASDALLTTSLSIRTKNGKVFSQVSQTAANDIQQLTISQSSDSEIEEISGFFYFKGAESTKSVCIINGISLIRMHVPEVKPDTTSTDSLSGDSLIDEKPRMSEEYQDIPSVELNDSAPSEGPGRSNRQNEVEQIQIEHAPSQGNRQGQHQRRLPVQQGRQGNNQNGQSVRPIPMRRR